MNTKELANFCGVSIPTITNIVESLNKETTFLTQNHIKKGGYHNSEVFYDDYLVKLIPSFKRV